MKVLHMLLVLILLLAWCKRPESEREAGAGAAAGSAKAEEKAGPVHEQPVDAKPQGVRCTIEKPRLVHEADRKIRDVDIARGGEGFAAAWIQGASAFVMELSEPYRVQGDYRNVSFSPAAGSRDLVLLLAGRKSVSFSRMACE